MKSKCTKDFNSPTPNHNAHFFIWTMNHSKLTIVSVYGHTNGASALPSITKSMQELPGSRGLLLSPAKPDSLPSNITWRKIGYLDYRMYSTFIMHCLYSFVETEFCLIVQDDGWVINGGNWRDEYYDYDYIGGVTHAGLVKDKLYLGFSWVNERDPILVQNGGFSLRSHRFLEAPNIHGIAQNYSTEIHLWNEDVQLSCLKRRLFEELGYRYASNDVAKYFSLEYVSPVFHDDMDFQLLLGHHCTTRKLVDQNKIYIPKFRDQVAEIFREVEYLKFLQASGYEIIYESL